MIQLEPQADGVILAVRAAAGSRRQGINGETNGALKVSVTQIAEKGKANKALIEVLCKSLRLKKSQVEIVGGETSQNKRFLLKKPSLI